MSIIACSVDGCERKFKGRGFCATHLSRFKKHGDPLIGAQKPANKSPCAHEGCDRQGQRVKGYCLLHYNRVVANGSSLDEHQAFVYGSYDKCIYCGDQSPDGPRRKRYCSSSCASSFSRGFKIPPPFPCAQCGIEVDLSVRLPTGRLRPRFTKVCVECKPPSHMKKHIPALIDRDGTDCMLCHELVDLDLKFPHPKSFSVDHVVPRSHGGANELENYRLTHLGCNSRRGNRLDYVAS